MGVDGYVDFCRIEDGHAEIDLTECPEIVRISGPVIIIPFYIRTFGKRLKSAWTADKHFEWLLNYSDDPGIVALKLGDLDWGPAVIPIHHIQGHHSDTWKTKGGPGGIPIEESSKYWEQLTPGYWAVTLAFRSGMGDEDWTFSNIDLASDVKLGSPVRMRLFT